MSAVATPPVHSQRHQPARVQPHPHRPAWRWLRRHGPALLLYAVTALFMFPFYWVFAHSFESAAEFQRSGPALWPSHPTLSNYYAVVVRDGFWHPILNSLIVASITTAITLVCASLAGYALCRLPIRGRPVVLGFVVLAGFFPMMAMIGPLFELMRQAGLLNTYVGLSISDLIYTLPLSTWLLASLFGQLPKDVEEAALVDGCTRLGALWRIVVPLAMPAIVTAGIFSFILAWSDFAFSLSFLETPNMYTAPLAIVTLGQGKYQIFYNYIDVALLLAALPIVALVLLAQRRIVSGLTTGAVR